MEGEESEKEFKDGSTILTVQELHYKRPQTYRLRNVKPVFINSRPSCPLYSLQHVLSVSFPDTIIDYQMHLTLVYEAALIEATN